MRTHLANTHNIRENSVAKDQVKRQSTLELYHRSRASLGKEQYLKLNRALALALALDMRPLSMVQGIGFRHFCKILNPLYQVPCSSTMKTNILALFEEAKKELIELVAGRNVAITTDLWSSTVSKRGYITITAHFLLDWKYVTRVLATRPLDGSHTAKHIAETLKEIQEEFKIHKLIAMTTDNAKNMENAGCEMNIIHVFCFSHTLQLSVQAGVSHAPIKRALAAARSLVGHFNHSILSTGALKEKQKSIELDDEPGTPKSLIQSVATRWNSDYKMAIRLIELRVSVLAVLYDNKVTKPGMRATLDLENNQWKILEQFGEVMKPFAIATEKLTSESSPTLSQVFIVIKMLITTACKPSDTDECPEIKKMKDCIRKDLTTRYKLDTDGTPKNVKIPALVASFLDPRYTLEI